MRLIVLLALFISCSAQGQWKSYIIGVRGDTLNRVDMNGMKQGPWINKIPDLRGERGYEEEGYYENDLKEGTWKKFSLQGVKIAEENYRWGKLSGKCSYYTYNGGLERIEYWRATDPKVAYDTVPVYDIKDQSKVVSYAVVKNEGISLKHGTWTYFDPVWGKVEATEKYWMNKLVTEDGDVLDDDIRPIDIRKSRAESDTAGKKTIKPQAVLDFEKKNDGKKKVKARDGSTGF